MVACRRRVFLLTVIFCATQIALCKDIPGLREKEVENAEAHSRQKRAPPAVVQQNQGNRMPVGDPNQANAQPPAQHGQPQDTNLNRQPDDSNKQQDKLNFKPGQGQQGHEGRPQSQQRQFGDQAETLHQQAQQEGQFQQQQNQQQFQRPAQQGSLIKLSETQQCGADIRRFCSPNIHNNNFALLSCLQNDDRTNGQLSPDCHHFLWQYKRNLTHDERFDSAASHVCKEELEKIPECANLPTGKGQKIPCLVDYMENVTANCRQYLSKMASIVFSDYRLIFNFVEKCSEDIEMYKCGRLNDPEDDDAPHSQGKTLDCLAQHMQQVKKTCRREILRVAELQSDDFHLDRPLYYACRQDRERFCEKVPAGGGQVFECLFKHKFERTMSKECRNKLILRQQMIAQDVRVEKTFFSACRHDIQAQKCLANLPAGDMPKRATILICLENALKDAKQIAQECYAEMTELRKSIMEDYQITPEIMKDCGEELKHCQPEEHQGKTLHCLMDMARPKRPQKGQQEEQGGLLSPTCMRALEDLVREAEPAGDFRIDRALAVACQPVAAVACKDIRPGDSRLLDCLMDKLDSEHMTDDCEERLLEIQYFVVRDFRLDPQLYKYCHKDATAKCHAPENWSDPESLSPNLGPLILPCLYRHMRHHDHDARMQISRACKAEVKRVMRHRAKRVELEPAIEHSCLHDLGEFCSDLDKYGPGHEIQCLQDNYESLSDDCQDTIGNFTEEEDEMLELDNILMQACTPMIKKFCSEMLDDDSEASEVMSCLIEHKRHPDMNHKCAAGVEHHQLIQEKDFKFSHKFKEACKADVLSLCRNKHTKSDVVFCLSEHVRNDTLLDKQHRVQKECRKQLRHELLQLGESIDLDPKLKNACQEDVTQYCSNVSPGNAQVIECLKTHQSRLSSGCHMMIFRREKDEAVVADYTLSTVCKRMIKTYCKVTLNAEDTLDCLKQHKDEAEFDAKCRAVVLRRLVTENRDYRLNPSLQKSCRMDIPKFCKDVITKEANDKDLEGKVIQCLKHQFLIKRLSRECNNEIRGIIQEAAMDFRQDPILAAACKDEIRKYCMDAVRDAQDRANQVEEAEEDGRGKVEECLKERFHKQEIEKNSQCNREIARILEESRVDVNVDPLLHTACQRDLYKFCGDLKSGEGRLMSCLLTVLEDYPDKLKSECHKLLAQRKELWEYAAQIAPVETFDELYSQISASPARFYMVGVIISILGLIFIVGITCGRVTKRHAKENKNK